MPMGIAGYRPVEQIVCVGETLWDVLTDGEYLGGAPLNVAAHATRLGMRGRLISRVGRDARGARAREELARVGLDTQLLQTDEDLPTGIAVATVDEAGTASYHFPEPSAWDRIAATDDAISAATGAIVVFGTLAQRSERNRETLARVLAVARWRVFDANLREPHIDRQVSIHSLRHADFVKVNEDEVRLFCSWLGIAPTAERLWAHLATDFGLRTLCVTEGVRGARLWHHGATLRVPAVSVKVADTIGAGDAFLAMLITQLATGTDAAVAMRRASHLAAYVASQHGALPQYTADTFLR